MLEEIVFAFVTALVGIVLLVGALRIFGVTIDWSKWGINLGRVYCPKCRKLMPYIRQPANEREEMWGGWTCDKCGTEMDKWCREVNTDE